MATKEDVPILIRTKMCLLFTVALVCGFCALTADAQNFQEVPSEDGVFRDRVLNFRVTRPGKQWRFFSDQPSTKSLSRCIALESKATSVFSPRIRIYTDESGNRDTADCSYLRPLERQYVDHILRGSGASVKWTETASPYYGWWTEACEESGEVRQEGERTALVRFIGMPAGTRVFTFVLITRPDEWEADNAALTDLADSFSAIEPWRSIRIGIVITTLCFGGLLMYTKRLATKK